MPKSKKMKQWEALERMEAALKLRLSNPMDPSIRHLNIAATERDIAHLKEKLGA